MILMPHTIMHGVVLFDTEVHMYSTVCTVRTCVPRYIECDKVQKRLTQVSQKFPLLCICPLWIDAILKRPFSYPSYVHNRM